MAARRSATARRPPLPAGLWEAYGLAVLRTNPVRSACLAETRSGPMFVKEMWQGPEELHFVAAAIDHLQRAGFRQLAPFLPTRTGQPFATVGNRRFVVTPWIAGREADYGEAADLKEATRLLAAMHEASRRFVPPPCPERILYGRWPQRFLARARQIVQMQEMAHRRTCTFFDRKFREWAGAFHSQALLAVELIERSPYAAEARAAAAEGYFCHHDIAHHNVLLTQQGDTYLVDFDYCICDLPAHDVASLTIRTMKRCGWSGSVAGKVLAEYDRTRPLRHLELQALAGFFTFPQDFWQVGVAYYLEDHPWPERTYHRRIDRCVEWRRDREEFLRWFYRLAGI